MTLSATVAPHPAAPKRRVRRAMVAAGSLLAVVGLAACTSVPSNDRVARDIIETQGSIPDDARQCMLDLLDTGNYDLDKIGEDNKNYTTPEELAANGTTEYQEMVSDLTACRTDATGTADAPTSTEPSASTGASSTAAGESSPTTPSGSTAG